MAYRLYRNNLRKLNEIEAKLLSFRKSKNPAMTLIRVSDGMPVPVLVNLEFF